MPPVNDTTLAMNEADDVGESDNSDLYSNTPEDLTFDNMDESDDEPISQDDDDDSDDSQEEEGGDSGDDEDEEKLGSEELKLLNDSDGKGPKKDEKKKEEESEDDEESEDSDAEEDGEEEEKKLPEPKTDAKKFRVKIGDEYYSLDSQATMKVKIDGKMTEVPIQELANDFSGRETLKKRFSDLDVKNKATEAKYQAIVQREQQINGLLDPIVKTIKDPLKDPTEAIIFLAEKLDKTGDLAATIEKRMLEANLERLLELSNMSEPEQEAFFVKKQNERLLKAAERRNVEEAELTKSNQLRAHVDKLRQTYGVSVDQYSEAFDELRSTLGDSHPLTHEQIVDWASQKPHHSTVQKILEPYQDEIDEDDYSGIVAQFSRDLRDRKLTQEQLQKVVKAEFGVPPVVKKLNTKLNIGKKKPEGSGKKPPVEQDRIESFDDFDN